MSGVENELPSLARFDSPNIDGRNATPLDKLSEMNIDGDQGDSSSGPQGKPRYTSIVIIRPRLTELTTLVESSPSPVSTPPPKRARLDIGDVPERANPPMDPLEQADEDDQDMGKIFALRPSEWYLDTDSIGDVSSREREQLLQPPTGSSAYEFSLPHLLPHESQISIEKHPVRKYNRSKPGGRGISLPPTSTPRLSSSVSKSTPRASAMGRSVTSSGSSTSNLTWTPKPNALDHSTASPGVTPHSRKPGPLNNVALPSKDALKGKRTAKGGP